eukprot:scaffold77871_cov62-Phaeocystis_antarctica.AAC.4
MQRAAGGWSIRPVQRPSLRLAPQPARGEATNQRRRDGDGIAPLLARWQPEATLRIVSETRPLGLRVRARVGASAGLAGVRGSARTSAPGSRQN